MGGCTVRLGTKGGCTVRLGTISSESLMGLLDTEAMDLLWLCVDDSRLGVHGLTVGGSSTMRLSVDNSRLSVNGLAVDRPGLSIDWLTVNWLHTIGGWCGVNGLDMSGCESILSLSLSLAHFTKQANRSLLLGSAIVEATNEAEVHGLQERMVMNIGTLTSFFTLDILLGRRSVVVRDGLVLSRILLLFLAILIGLSKSSINAGSKVLVSDTLLLGGITFSSFTLNSIGCGFGILAGFFKSSIDGVRSGSSFSFHVSSSIITFKFSAGCVGGQEGQ